MPEPRQYELMYVISPEVGEDGIASLHTQVDEIVGGLGGRIEKTDNWGRRRLAYAVDNHREGIYVIELIAGPGELVKELDRKLKVIDSVLRHLIVRVDEDLRKSARARQKRQARQQRRHRPGGSSPRETNVSSSAGGPDRTAGPDTVAPERRDTEQPEEEQ